MVSCYYYYFGIVALMQILGSNGQKSCRTTTNTPGSCISIYDCSSVLNLLRQSSLSRQASQVDIVRKSQCGFQGLVPMVCCPQNNEMPMSTKMQMDEAPKSPMMVPLPPPGPPHVTNHRNLNPPMIVTPPPGPPDVTNHPNLKFLDKKLCGPITQGKIINGNKTSVFEFPWMALLAYSTFGNNTAFKCAGTVISSRYVLTAAHCVTGLSSEYKLIGVRVGEHDTSKEKDCDSNVCADTYQDFYIESFHAHSEYGKLQHENDIALIRLDGDVDFKTNNVRPICLPIENAAATMQLTKVTVTGWGKTEKGYRSPDLLQVRLNIASHDDCAKAYKTDRIDISYKQLCAGGESRMDSCTGDSGGPLQSFALIDNTPKYLQYGIVSFGPEKCGVIGYPGVYTKVAYYMDWILDTMVA